MYEYKYIRMDTGGSFWFGNVNAPHREIIDQQAAEGWRYAGYVPTEFTSHGGVSSIDLVFERPAAAKEE